MADDDSGNGLSYSHDSNDPFYNDSKSLSGFSTTSSDDDDDDGGSASSDDDALFAPKRPTSNIRHRRDPRKAPRLGPLATTRGGGKKTPADQFRRNAPSSVTSKAPTPDPSASDVSTPRSRILRASMPSHLKSSAASGISVAVSGIGTRVLRLVRDAGLLASSSGSVRDTPELVEAARDDLQALLEHESAEVGARVLAAVWMSVLAEFADTTKLVEPLMWLERCLLRTLGTASAYSEANLIAGERHFWLLKNYASLIDALTLLHRLFLCDASINTPPAPSGLSPDVHLVAKDSLHKALMEFIFGRLDGAKGVVERSLNKSHAGVLYAGARVDAALTVLKQSFQNSLAPETERLFALVLSRPSLGQAISFFTSSCVSTATAHWYPASLLLQTMTNHAIESEAALINLQSFLYQQTGTEKATWRWIFAICDALAYIGLNAPKMSVRAQALQGRQSDHLDLLDLVHLSKFRMSSKNKHIRAGVEAAVRRLTSWSMSRDNEVITELETELDRVSDELASERLAHSVTITDFELQLKHSHQALEEKIRFLTAQLETSESARETAERAADRREGEATTATASASELQAQLASVTARADSLQASLQAAPSQAAFHELRARVQAQDHQLAAMDALQDELAALRAAKSTLDTNAAKHSQVTDALQAALAANAKLTSALKETKSKSSRLKAAAREQAQELETASSSRDELVKALSALKSELASAKASWQTSQERYEADAADASSRVRELTTELESVSTAKTAATTQVHSLTEQLEAAKASIHSLQASLAEQSAAAAKSAATLASLQEEMVGNVRDNHASLAEASKRADETQNKVQALEAKLATAQESVAQLSETKSALTTKLDHVNDDLSSVNGKLATVTETNAQLRSRGSALETQLEEARARIAELSDADLIGQLKHQVTAANAALATETEHHSATKTARDEALASGSALAKDLSQVSSTAATLERDLDNVRDRLARVESELAQERGKVSEWSQKYHALVDEHKELHSAHTQKASSLSAHETNLTAANRRISTLEAESQALREELDATKGMNTSLVQNLDTSQARCADLEATLARERSEQSHTSSTLEEAEQKVAKLEAQISAELEPALADARVSIARLESELKASDSARKALQGDYDTVRSAFAAAEERAEKAEARVAALSAELNASQEAHTETVVELDTVRDQLSASEKALARSRQRVATHVKTKRDDLMEWARSFGPAYVDLVQSRLDKAGIPQADNDADDALASDEWLSALLAISSAINAALHKEITDLRREAEIVTTLHTEYVDKLGEIVEDNQEGGDLGGELFSRDPLMPLSNVLSLLYLLYEREYEGRLLAIREGRLISQEAMVEAAVAAEMEAQFLKLRSKLTSKKKRVKKAKHGKLAASALSRWSGRQVDHFTSSSTQSDDGDGDQDDGDGQDDGDQE